jgi:hypothetical protein
LAVIFWQIGEVKLVSTDIKENVSKTRMRTLFIRYEIQKSTEAFQINVEKNLDIIVFLSSFAKFPHE